MNMQVLKEFRTPNRHDQKRTSPHHSTIKKLREQKKERILKSAREK
jgi:hypothetical protein